MKPFNLEEAKAGNPVCTLEGYPVTILAFDLRNEDYPIVAAVHSETKDNVYSYTVKGEYVPGKNYKNNLMMASMKQERWINAYPGNYPYEYYTMYKTKEEALKGKRDGCEATLKIEWIEWEE